MIAKLAGLLDSAGSDSAIVDVGGVGYLVFCSGRTLAKLPAKGAPVSLLVETHVREDHIHLYGFADAAEREWFRLLTTVQGVGAKLGLAILGTLAPDDLARAIASGDKASLSRPAGVGPKLAARARGSDEDLEIGAKLLLADEFIYGLRTQRGIDAIFRRRLGRHHAWRRHWLSSCNPARIRESTGAALPKRRAAVATASKASARR